MRRALEEYRVVGVKTNIPFHQRIMDSHHFISGEFDTRFVEERFSMDEVEDGKEAIPHVAAILAALVSHHQTQRVAQIRRHGDHRKSGWKWAGRRARLEK
jgi:acetyl-CoA carboxylase biotin carboxylase subunit